MHVQFHNSRAIFPFRIRNDRANMVWMHAFCLGLQKIKVNNGKRNQEYGGLLVAAERDL